MVEYWKGQPIAELSKEELLEVINNLCQMMESQRALHNDFLNSHHNMLMSAPAYRPQSFFQWLFGAK